MNVITRNLRRRTVLGGAAAAAAGAMVYPARGTFAASETPVRIGMIDPQTGTYAGLGTSEITGAKVALDEVNKAGGILGRPVELLVEDSAADPGTAVQKARKLVNSDKVNFLMGSVSSAVALSLNQAAEELKTLYLCTGGHTDQVTGTQCRWTTFRTCSTTWMLTAGNFQTLFDKYGKNWYFITPDYAFGHSLEKDYSEQLVKAGGKVLGNALAPLGTTDFSSYLIQARAAKPSVLIMLTAGDDLVNSLKQATQFGLDKEMAIGGALQELEVLQALPAAARLGWWTFEWWWDQPNQPHVADFVAAYKAASGGKVPSARSWFGFASLHALALAANKAKALDTMSAVKAMEGLELPPEVALQPNNPFYRAADHQLIANEFPGYVIPNGTYPNLFHVADIVPESKIGKSAAEAGCKMTYPS
ncbi:MAG TPA: ABC transporter substrate-binding protein [Acetobacteraceae bacterium]|nr:ABC transporter substrate-binding protein [Acetobacteraceae bacterium]